MKDVYTRFAVIDGIVHDAQLWSWKLEGELTKWFVTRCGLQTASRNETTQPTICVSCLATREE